MSYVLHLGDITPICALEQNILFPTLRSGRGSTVAERGKAEGHRAEGGGQRLQDHTVSSWGHSLGDTGRESVSCQTRTEFTVTQTEDTVLILTSGFSKFLSCDWKPGFCRLGGKDQWWNSCLWYVRLWVHLLPIPPSPHTTEGVFEI